jgi:hypothetical protein
LWVLSIPALHLGTLELLDESFEDFDEDEDSLG